MNKNKEQTYTLRDQHFHGTSMLYNQLGMILNPGALLLYKIIIYTNSVVLPESLNITTSVKY